MRADGDFSWFESRDGWRKLWHSPRSMQTVVFRILRGCNEARVDLHHQAASECDLDYRIARNIVEAFLASGWRPPEGARPQLFDGERLVEPRLPGRAGEREAGE